MKTKPLPERNSVQKIFEAVLKWSIPGIVFFHTLCLLAKYFLENSINDVLLITEKWTLIIYISIGLAYCLYTAFILPEQMCRIRAYLKGLFRPEMILLLLLFAWNIFCVFSADKVYKNNFWEANDPVLFDLFISFFIFFAFAYVLKGQKAREIMEILFYIIAAVMTGLMIWVLWAICKPSVIVLPGDVQIGMSKSGRLTINCHPNTVGSCAELILMICMYLAVTKKGIVRILNILAMPVHYIVLILTDSRTCIIATSFAVAVVVSKLVFDAAKGKTGWKRILLSFLAFSACFALLMALRWPVKKGYDAISHFSEINGKGALSKERRADLTFNGRVSLWVAAVQSAFSEIRNAFFGVTPVAVISEINKWTGKDRNYYTHNQFMEVLVSNGIPGLLLYVSWLALIAKKCFKNILIRIDGTNKGTVVIGGMILMLVIANLFEATLLYYRFFAGSFFFLLCGMVAYDEGEEKRKSGNRNQRRRK